MGNFNRPDEQKKQGQEHKHGQNNPGNRPSQPQQNPQKKEGNKPGCC